LVTFVWQPERRVKAPSLFTPVGRTADKKDGLHSLGVGGVWYLSLRLSRRTRAVYGFSPRPAPPQNAPLKAWVDWFRSLQKDPLNPRRFVYPKDPDDKNDSEAILSLVELPRAPPQPWARDDHPLRATEERVRMRSRYLRGTRSVWVFLPPGFDPRKRRYNLVLAFDGIAYRDMVPTPRIVERLADAGRISPTVVVLVGNAAGARTKELDRNPDFTRFLVQELFPWLRRRYGVVPEASRTVAAGSSLGGVAAAYAAFHYPRRFGNVLAQSGAFLWAGPGAAGQRRSLMHQYARAPKLPLRFYLDAGTHEMEVPEGQVNSLLGGVRHMRDVLEAKGYPVRYAEFEGGHDYSCWAGTLADGLLFFLGTDRFGRTG
jgi:enterochelin esterase family protein